MLSETLGVIRLTLHVQPGAKRNAVVGTHGDALKIAISAPPVDGKANEAVQSFIASALDIPARAITIAAGQSSRRKTIEIAGYSLREIKTRLDVLLPPSAHP